MTSIYEIRTYTPAGVETARISDYKSFSCRSVVGAPGILTVELDGTHPAISGLSDLSQVEVWRKDTTNNIDWYRYFGGLYRAQKRTWDEVPKFEMRVVGYLWWLWTRIIDYPAGTANRTKFTSAKAETIMKTLVDYNAGANATTANGRKRTGTITGISIATDTTAGNTLDYVCHGANLLESLQKISKIAGGDYDLVKTGAQAWQFRWYTGQLGTDRTASVTFSMINGTMGKPSYEYDRITEKTIAAVWGPGTDSSREYTTRPSVTPTPEIEMYVDAKDTTTVAGREARGDEKLREARAIEKFNFQVLQTPAVAFNVDYFLGDLVTVNNPFTGTDTTQKITAATIRCYPDGKEEIQIEVSTP